MKAVIMRCVLNGFFKDDHQDCLSLSSMLPVAVCCFVLFLFGAQPRREKSSTFIRRAGRSVLSSFFSLCESLLQSFPSNFAPLQSATPPPHPPIHLPKCLLDRHRNLL